MRFKEKLRDRKRELELERVQFVKKGKRALQRKAKQTETDPESSDVDGNCPSTSSRSVTPAPRPAFQLRSPSSLSSPEFTSAPKQQESPESPTYFRYLVPPPHCREEMCVCKALYSETDEIQVG